VLASVFTGAHGPLAIPARPLTRGCARSLGVSNRKLGGRPGKFWSGTLAVADSAQQFGLGITRLECQLLGTYKWFVVQRVTANCSFNPWS
jgi:hypothetical protein